MTKEQLISYLQSKGLNVGLAETMNPETLTEEKLNEMFGNLIPRPSSVEDLLKDDVLKGLANSHADKRVSDGVKAHDEKLKKEGKLKEEKEEEPKDDIGKLQKMIEAQNKMMMDRLEAMENKSVVSTNQTKLAETAKELKLKPELLGLITVNDKDTEATIKEKVQKVITTVGDAAKVSVEAPTPDAIPKVIKEQDEKQAANILKHLTPKKEEK